MDAAPAEWREESCAGIAPRGIVLSLELDADRGHRQIGIKLSGRWRSECVSGFAEK